jgi:hypothetical protein
MLVLVVGILVCVGGCSSGPDLVANGDFELQATSDNKPEGWSEAYLSHTKDLVKFSWDDQVAHAGARSISIAIDAGHPDEVVNYNWTKAVPSCEVGKRYELTGWVRAENLNATAWIVIQCWNEAMDDLVALINTYENNPVTGTSDWTEVRTTFTVPEGTAEVRIRAGIATPENRGGRVWFDDISIRELS